MCIGIPMRVVDVEGGVAWCESMGGTRQRIDTLLTGTQPRGTWLLVFLGSAREVISEQEAVRIDDALNAIAAVMNGSSFENHFQDLVDREPVLPDFLRPQGS